MMFSDIFLQMLIVVILNSFSEMYCNSEDEGSDSLFQDTDDSMLKSLKEAMLHNDVEEVDRLTSGIEDVISLSKNAFAM